MPRPTIKIKLTCSKCGKDFKVLKWEFSNKQKRKTTKYYCSAKCKHEFQRIGGPNSGTWNGGRYKLKLGYVMVNLGPNKRMFEHRYVMEKHLGRKLIPGEVIHHLNENTSDNRIENLVLCKSAGEHNSKYHSLHRRRNGTFETLTP